MAEVEERGEERRRRKEKICERGKEEEGKGKGKKNKEDKSTKDSRRVGDLG